MKKIARLAKGIVRLTKKITSLTKKFIKATVKRKFIFSCLNIGAKVHSLLPRYDKIEGIDTDKLIREHRYEI